LVLSLGNRRRPSPRVFAGTVTRRTPLGDWARRLSVVVALPFVGWSWFDSLRLSDGTLALLPGPSLGESSRRAGKRRPARRPPGIPAGDGAAGDVPVPEAGKLVWAGRSPERPGQADGCDIVVVAARRRPGAGLPQDAAAGTPVFLRGTSLLPFSGRPEESPQTAPVVSPSASAGLPSRRRALTKRSA
jgi:hypothetical protein